MMKLQQRAWELRRSILEMVQASQSGHLGGSLSAIDILTVLYFGGVLQVTPETQDDPRRDRFVMSKGHATPALYSTLAARGFIDRGQLAGWRGLESNLSGHAEMTKIPGVEMSTGSLGQGLSVAVGMALAARVDKLDYRVFALVGDGELQEGQIWEAAMAAGHYGVSNLVMFVDNNDLQIDGCIADVLSPYPIGTKFAAFGWQVIEIDGHDLDAIAAAIDAAGVEGRPTAIVAKTVKGKGISYMENVAAYHGSVPTPELFAVAFSEVDAHLKENDR